MAVSLASLGLPPHLSNIIQERVLERRFQDALFSNLEWRRLGVPEQWAANEGETHAYTRTGLIPVDPKPRQPGQDPTPSSFGAEQWEVTANVYDNTIDTHMPSSRVTLASKLLEDTEKLGLNAAQTLNRVARNKLLSAYLEGETVLIAAALSGATQIRVASLNGFRERLLNGRPTPVSAANAIPITFSAGPAANTVVGFAPDNADDPLGLGTLTLGAALSAPAALRAGVRAGSRSLIHRVGGGVTVDALTGVEFLTLDDIRTAIAQLRNRNVPPMPDGFYHVIVTVDGESQLFRDNEFQRLHESSLGRSPEYRQNQISELIGCRFYRDTESPNAQSVSSLADTSGGGGSAQAAPEIGGEIHNQSGVLVRRALVCGGKALIEKWVNEGAYLTEAGTTGFQRFGNFTVVNNGLQIMAERVRYIMRAPLDRRQENISQTWSFSGDWGRPSDILTGDPARYKRAMVIEHA